MSDRKIPSFLTKTIAVLAMVGAAILVNVGIFDGDVYETDVSMDTPSTVCLQVAALEQASAALVKTPNGKTVLVDCGNHHTTDDLSSLLSDVETPLDVLVLTHNDEGHVGGFRWVVETYGVKTVVAHPAVLEAGDYALAQDPECTVSVENPTCGERFVVDGVSFTCLSPYRFDNDGNDDNALVLRMTYRNFSTVLLGDAGEKTTEFLVQEAYDIRSDFLVMTGYGETLPTNSFWDKVDVKGVLLSCEGQTPTDKQLSDLQDRNLVVCRTDTEGVITLCSDGVTYRLSTQYP